MTMMTLNPYHPFDAQKFAVNHVEIEAEEGLAMISVATPKGGEKALAAAMKKAFKIAMPAIGQSTSAGDCTALGMQADQCFLLMPYASPRSAMEAQAALGNAAYTTDQSDGWVFVLMRGRRVEEALARICKLDLASFTKGQVARTSMEHLGVVIFAQSEGEYLLMSARSSAQNFWHALTQSAENLL